MRLSEELYRVISKHNNNLLLAGLITFTFPTGFVRSIYSHNRGLDLWNGKRSCFTLSFDCDYPEDIQALPNLVKMLARYRYKASFACVGAWMEKYPHEHALILEYGHEIVNHTYSHPDNELLNPGRKFRYISTDEKKKEVESCHSICSKLFGYEPRGCRIPHFKNLFTADIYAILKELGYLYSSSTWLTNTVSHGLPYQAAANIVEFPVSVCPKHPFTVFDTWHSLHSKRLVHRIVHRSPEAYLDLLKLLISIGLETGSYINIYLDPLDMGRIQGFEQVLEILAQSDIIVCSYDEYIKNDLYVSRNTRTDN